MTHFVAGFAAGVFAFGWLIIFLLVVSDTLGRRREQQRRPVAPVLQLDLSRSRRRQARGRARARRGTVA